MVAVYAYAIKLLKGQKMSVSTNSSATSIECIWIVEIEDNYRYHREFPSEKDALAYAHERSGDVSDFYHSACCPCGWFEREHP
jgi:uncharacterized protein YodC (DUF2158 family)